MFGWHIEQVPGVDYWRVETSSSDGLHGGLMYRAIADLNGWLFYIKVNCLEQVVAEVTSLGGKVIRPKTAVPKTAWVTIVADPQGNTFGVWQADATALPMPEPD